MAILKHSAQELLQNLTAFALRLIMRVSGQM
jgi:hypothetical protein